MRTVRYAGHVSLVQDTALLYMGRYVSMVQAGDHVDFPLKSSAAARCMSQKYRTKRVRVRPDRLSVAKVVRGTGPPGQGLRQKHG